MVRSLSRQYAQFPFIGNHRFVDFVKTESLRRGRRVDLLAEFSDLVAWLVATQRLESGEARDALDRWGNGSAGARVLAQARDLRGSFRELLEQIVRGRPVPASTVAAINTVLARHIGYTELVPAQQRFRQEFRFEWRAAVDLLVPLAQAAADFLCEADFSLVRKCGNAQCVRFFYDLSKNHARRWCTMSVCGNRMKVAAHYRRVQRKRQGRSKRFGSKATG